MNTVRGGLMAGAAVVAAIAIAVSNKNGSPPGDDAVARTASSESRKPPPKSKSAESPRRKVAARAGLPPPVESPHPPESAESRDWITTRKNELERLAWFDDSESMNRILAELGNPLPEIRAAALAAAISFGSRDAVPHLEQFAATTADPQERKALADAIDFLKLASLTEYLEEEPATDPLSD